MNPIPAIKTVIKRRTQRGATGNDIRAYLLHLQQVWRGSPAVLAEIERLQPPAPTRKTCCCCGDGTKGAQWHNRDTGFGICPKCIRWMKSRQTPAAELLDLYGVEGVHYMPTEAE